ncbi:MAG: HD domain-containing protein [Chloroflexota bacterium]
MKLPSRLKIPPALRAISDFLAESRTESYLVGGALRDLVLGRETSDLDIAVKGQALEIARKAATALNGKYVALDEANGTARVLLPGKPEWQIDFTGFGGTIEQDLGRRDFTVGAMAANLAHMGAGPSPIIDPYHGLEDLSNGIIRVVSDGTFRADPLRLLRAVRLASELGFTIERHTEDLIKREAPLISQSAGERLREELLRILALPSSGQRWAYFDRLGLVTELFPELKSARGIRQPEEHHWDVLHHSLMTEAAAGFLLRQGEWEYASPDVLDVVPWSAELAAHFETEVSHGSTRSTLLKLAGLLHDVAKPETRVVTESGRTRFLGHADLGATVTADILIRLRFSTREVKLVETLVKYHLRPTQMSQTGLPSPRAIYRYFRDTGEAGLDTLYLSLADHLAARGPGLLRAEWRRHSETVAYVTRQHFEANTPAKPPRLLTGHDLIGTFNLSPGPRIGEILEAVREATAAGELASKAQAMEYAGVLLAAPPKSRRHEKDNRESRGKVLPHTPEETNDEE